MAFVRKRAGRWYVRYVDETGIQVERMTLAATKTETVRLAEELERRAERVRFGLETAVIELTVREAYENHFKPIVQGRAGFPAMDSRFRNHILNNVVKQPSGMKEFHPSEFARKLCHLVRPADIEALLAQKEREGLGPVSREHVRVELSSLFTFVIEKMKAFRGEHPVREVNKVRIPERPPKFLEACEVPAAMAHTPDRWRGFIATAVYTGLRFKELRQLRVAEVLLDRRMLSVWNTKNTKSRYVPIPEELVPYLQVELGRSRSEWLFPRHDGTQLTKDCGALRMFRRALKRAGIVQGYDHQCRTRGRGKGCGYEERRADDARGPCPKCGRFMEVVGVPKDIAIKDLRSTFGTHAAEQTGDLRAVQRALGHSSIAVTEQRYAFARDRHFVEQLSTLSLKNSARPLPETVREFSQNRTNTVEVVRLDRRKKPSKSQQQRTAKHHKQRK